MAGAAEHDHLPVPRRGFAARSWCDAIMRGGQTRARPRNARIRRGCAGFLPEYTLTGRGDAPAPEATVTLDMPGKAAGFLRTVEPDDTERAALDVGVTIRGATRAIRAATARPLGLGLSGQRFLGALGRRSFLLIWRKWVQQVCVDHADGPSLVLSRARTGVGVPNSGRARTTEGGDQGWQVGNDQWKALWAWSGARSADH